MVAQGRTLTSMGRSSYKVELFELRVKMVHRGFHSKVIGEVNYKEEFHMEVVVHMNHHTDMEN